MRIHSVLALSAISATLYACSSGGVGNPIMIEPPPIGDNGGASVPALGPSTPSATGGDDTPPQDGGTKDTGGGTLDTGVKDTGTPPTDTGGSSICKSTCTADSASAESACNAAITGTTCATQYKAYYTCRSTNRVCDTTGKTDESAIASACASEQSAVTTCLGG